ncbi:MULTISPECIES: toxin-antitoxin system HicB family antitoxin [unclassified Tatumella]|uniref:toxin-antitoxin system HicB family antitoxin n=1 Tax=unclassified Tatumella TaxID=2649542 RepID=UPI001BAEAB66|nr:MULTISPECIES: toxin-antitoxin system HicB family antitoxin [unclassified Tatumella]MBS0854539.1 toxin-antitoxin system HicB family antitoxin [Tatumella sp. JGM16]MBS0911243.1 toxin-antitoxin system HicB family antitoxin [Tatumella sp. JGM91]
MSIIERDKVPKGAGRSPMFNVRLSPELKAQFEAAATAENMSLGNWLKTLGRKELERLGIEPKG